MAQLVAEHLVEQERPVRALYVSPLLRARQSAAPIAAAFDLPLINEPRIIEPWNHFEGLKNHGPDAAFTRPQNWWRMWNPLLPSWGEPYTKIRRRMRAAVDDAWEETVDGDIVMVLHQAPIWNTHLWVSGKPLAHNPASRRCALSSITSFTRDADGRWSETGYAEPAADIDTIDLGAV